MGARKAAVYLFRLALKPASPLDMKLILNRIEEAITKTLMSTTKELPHSDQGPLDLKLTLNPTRHLLNPRRLIPRNSKGRTPRPSISQDDGIT